MGDEMEVDKGLDMDLESNPNQQSAKPIKKVFEIKSVAKNKAIEPVKSIEGWIIIVTNLHEEVSEEDIADVFNEFGEVQNIHLNLDRQTGYVKGYALIEYESFEEADKARQEANGFDLLGKKLTADFAFVESADSNGEERSRNKNHKMARSRSRSPQR